MLLYLHLKRQKGIVMKSYSSKLSIKYFWERKDGGEIKDSWIEMLDSDARDIVIFGVDDKTFYGKLHTEIWDTKEQKEFTCVGIWEASTE